MESIMDFFMEKILLPFLMIAVAGIIFVAIPFGIYSSIQQSKSPTLELYKNEWTCTETAKKRVNVMVGKVMTTRYEDVCVNYQYAHKE